MWSNLVSKDIRNLPIATIVRLGFLVKDALNLKDDETNQTKYFRMRNKAINKGLVDSHMQFKD